MLRVWQSLRRELAFLIFAACEGTAQEKERCLFACATKLQKCRKQGLLFKHNAVDQLLLPFSRLLNLSCAEISLAQQILLSLPDKGRY